jgi:hypothetical protein
MSGVFRRYEILLPVRFNDGSKVPSELLADFFLELRARFGAASVESQTIRGSWIHEGQTYEDELVRFFVDAHDSAENTEYFRQLKQSLKARFQQLEIWITTYRIDLI